MELQEFVNFLSNLLAKYCKAEVITEIFSTHTIEISFSDGVVRVIQCS